MSVEIPEVDYHGNISLSEDGTAKISYRGLPLSIYNYDELTITATCTYKKELVTGIFKTTGLALASYAYDMESIGTPGAAPHPVVSYHWEREEIKAGGTAKLIIRVDNKGEGELYRLVAVVHSSADFVDGKRIELGRIDPDDYRERMWVIQVPKEWKDTKIDLTIEFEEYNNNIPESFDTQFTIIQ